MDNELRRRIRDAFSQTQLPSRPITGHRCTECDETDHLLGDRAWSDVIDDFPEYCHDTFPLLTNEAQRYFLPAYMVAALDSSGMQGLSVEFALQSDALPPESFTREQRAAVRDWIGAYVHKIGRDVVDEQYEDLLSRWATGK